jgi:hypothetical protein
LAIGFKDWKKAAGMSVLAMALVAAVQVRAQYPGQLTKPKDAPVLRAISVLEWTGDEGHPKASHLVPVLVYDSGELNDGGIYLARPQPLSLSTEVEYELQRNGKPIGLYEIKNAGQEQGSWVGYGVWKAALPAPKAKPAAVLPLNPSWDDPDDRPVLHRKHHADDPPAPGAAAPTPAEKSSTTASANDPDRPVLHKKSASDDPDRPVLHKKADTPETASTDPAPDPDRPTLHKRPADSNPASGKKKKHSQRDIGYVDAVSDVTDPDRPRLKRGAPEGAGLNVLPSLLGLPPDLKQAVAVSDARITTEHQWSYGWSDADDEEKMKGALEVVARGALGLTPPSAPAPKPVKMPAKRSRKAVKPADPPPTPAPLVDEDFRVYELAYGSGATLVLTAHTGGQGEADKHVTLIAQPDLYGNLRVLLKNVTDAAHLDTTPRMRLVDAVDALSDNRGELLFELRGESERQFALYRVLRGQAERIFATAPADIVTAPRAAND